MKRSLVIPLSVLLLASCQKENLPEELQLNVEQKRSMYQDDNNGNFKININGLENLGQHAVYENWLIVEGNPVSAGTFMVDEKGKPTKSVFKVPEQALENAVMFVLTVEPYPDNDPGPSNVHLVGGSFNGNKSTEVTVAHPAALGNDYTMSSGKFILGTPTDGPNSYEESGIWFLSLASGSPMKGLTLPNLPTGWKYEGWVVLNGKPVSTGTFMYTDMKDDSGIFSGPMASPPFPGEDFLNNAPMGLNFPTTLRGSTVVVSIEPYPDNSPAPFLLKPLYTGVPLDAATFTDISLMQNLGSFPTGTVHKTK
jgi:hypothetical protein